MSINILVINPGSTSSKIELWKEQENRLYKSHEAKLAHSVESLEPFKGKNVIEQLSFRKESKKSYVSGLRQYF